MRRAAQSFIQNGRLRALVATCVATLFLTGCVGYRLGSMLPPDIRTVYIPTFVNETEEPFLEVDTTRAAIDEFQKDGSLKVVDEEQADAFLEVNLIEYSLSPLAYSDTKRTTANEYRIHLTAHVKLRRASTGEVIMEDPAVRGEATFDVVGDLSSSKLTGLPEASEDLAHDIVERVVEFW